jgi:hypothetical protein
MELATMELGNGGNDPPKKKVWHVIWGWWVKPALFVSRARHHFNLLHAILFACVTCVESLRTVVTNIVPNILMGMMNPHQCSYSGPRYLFNHL